MDIPTTRELELEVLIRERDKQLSQLKTQVEKLRKANEQQQQEAPPENEAITLPPRWVAYLTPLIQAAQSGSAPGSGKGSVTAALTQRLKQTQEENEELYEVLRQSVTGKLQEEVQLLRRNVTRLETALTDSHTVIESLRSELAFYDTNLKHTMRTTRETSRERQHLHRPESSRRSPTRGPSNHSSVIPTGPRAHKKPRLSTSETTSPRLQEEALHSPPRAHSKSAARRPVSPPRRDNKSRSRDSRQRHGGDSVMDTDEHTRHRRRTPPGRSSRERTIDRDRERDRDRDRQDRVRNRERESERPHDWERDRSDRRNGSVKRIQRSGNNGRSSHINGSNQSSGDRGLAERMGL